MSRKTEPAGLQVIPTDNWIIMMEYSIVRMLARAKTQTRRLPTLVHRPYAEGDILYVREKHWRDRRERDTCVIYSATPEFYMYRNEGVVKRTDTRTISPGPNPTRAECRRNLETHRFWKEHSPLLFPRWAARIFVRVTARRREPLQAITPADCRAEGVGFPALGLPDDKLVAAYREVWDRMHTGAAERWEANPEVYVYDFEYLEESQSLTAERALAA